jgi:alkanesulfonate monooxygenase SsuD/methylene tetrahydromethanopterin reductase-like flavin-dependent oxidoreductase (luciferase family)
MAGSVRPAIERAGKYFDGWFAIEPSLARWSEQWAQVQQIVCEAGRDVSQFAAAIYLTLAIDEDASRAERRIDAFLENYYGQPASVIHQRQACYGGPAAGAAQFLHSYANAGASHIIVRFTGEPEGQLEALTRVCAQLDW